jgi:nuclear pore complex protein Nup155
VDDHRKCLYTVSTDQSVEVWYLGADGLDPSISSRGVLRDIARQAQTIAPGSNSLDPRNFEIVLLSVIAPDEAQSDVHFVLVTSKGVRLYMTHRSSGYGYNPGYTSQPSAPRILQVRIPPSQLVHMPEGSSQRDMLDSLQVARTFQITQVANAFYSRGLVLLSQAVSTADITSTATLVCMFPDSPSIAPMMKFETPQNNAYPGNSYAPFQRPPLAESVKLITVQGEAWAIAEWTNDSNVKPLSPFNELVTQFSQPHREFAVFSSSGISSFLKLRPVDVLYALIQRDARPELEVFVKRSVIFIRLTIC